MHTLVKSFSLSLIKNVSFCKINGSKVLILHKQVSDESQYIIIPNYISCKKFEKNLIFYSLKFFTKQFFIFINFFSIRLKRFNKNTRKRLVLTGLGYKVNFSGDNKFLSFKIGLSHIASIEIPLDEVQIFIVKNTIIIEGLNPTSVGNFSKRIKQLKLPDSYKGKGLWYKNEIKILKPIKKT